MVAKPLVVVLGPTGSGKSELAMSIAKKFNGELICADSRTIYKGMDIGTAKPEIHDRKEVIHHMLDIIEPDEVFSAARFKALAQEAVGDIESRGKLPVIVGGTGLYIDSLIFDFAFLPKASNDSREELNILSLDQLQKKINDEDIAPPNNFNNRRHLIRAIETNGQVPVRRGMRDNTLVLGINISRDSLRDRIESRTQNMLSSGLEAEVLELSGRYGSDAPGLLSVGYREWSRTSEPAEVAKLINAATMQYAKRQMTWFRRNEQIDWIDSKSDAMKLVQNFLQQK